MSISLATLVILLAAAATTTCCAKELAVVQSARDAVLQARNWALASVAPNGRLSEFGGQVIEGQDSSDHQGGGDEALSECARLYAETESRLATLLHLPSDNYTVDDARTWLSSALACHRTCLDGLQEKGLLQTHANAVPHSNLTLLLADALSLYAKPRGIIKGSRSPRPGFTGTGGILASWSPATSKAHFVVALDGSGTHRTINEALASLSRLAHTRPHRVIIYVKSGVYNERVEVPRHMNNVMFVGDGMDRTIVTGHRSVRDGSTTSSSATFGVSGDGFWARDMTFENTAGPQKHQAVALRVSSDLSVFYRCSFRGYQDTLYTHSLRQFYRDCHIYGTVDFIFGDAAAVFQNCDIFVRRPMQHQANMVTAQGRDNRNENTGISIIGSRIRPAADLVPVSGSFRSYLGRPWKKYSTTVVFKTDLDGIIHPRGWTEWRGNFALSTLYYAEYSNTGVGASTANRVNWPGFHVLRNPRQASPFTVSRFIQGDSWIPASGVPCSLGI